jgi:DNA-binding response OmpR family regulator
MTTILVVEDETSLREALAYNLMRQEYTVEMAGDGVSALDAARRLQPDLIILDIMLPGLDGFEVCRILRQEMTIPILMLTARDDEIDRVIGLEIGADDYITKPFSMRELMARVKAHLRRERILREDVGAVQTTDPKGVLRLGNLALDLARHEVLLENQPLALKPKEFELLLFIAQHRGQALSREFLLKNVWGWEFSGGTRTVDVHVHWLREKIEVDPAQPVRIVTVRGSGYRFDEVVEGAGVGAGAEALDGLRRPFGAYIRPLLSGGEDQGKLIFGEIGDEVVLAGDDHRQGVGANPKFERLAADAGA